MKFQEMVEEWRADSRLDINEIGDEIAKTYTLQQKYLEIMLQWRAATKQLERKLAIVRRERSDYYTGRAEKPSPHRIMKSEAPLYIEADEEFQGVSERLETSRTAVYFLENVLKQIASRQWDLRTAQEWHKMVSGGNR